jgi:hypothetical protein
VLLARKEGSDPRRELRDRNIDFGLVAPTSTDLAHFADEVRRLVGRGEPPLYPAFKSLFEAVYPSEYTVDSLLRAPGAGFPDFTISRGPRLANWIEVKAPTVDVKPLPAPDAERFDRYRYALPHIVLTNGWHWILYEGGDQSARVELPPDWLLGARALTSAEEGQLFAFFDRMTALRPAAAQSYEEAVGLLATAARLVEHAVLDAAAAGLPSALGQARASFTELLQTNPADPSEIGIEEFADALAQTVTFGYLLARVEAGHDVDPGTAIDALNSTEHPFLRSTLYAVIAPDPNLETALRGVLRTASDAVNGAAPKLAGPTGAWERVPYVYEKFFEQYRPEDRFKYGVFYTPEDITRFQVREIRSQLVESFGLSGLLDPGVRFLDPACGTGTYLLALAEEALAEATGLGLPAASALRELFADRVVGFDVSPGPASVAQARLTAWLRSKGVALGARFPVFTTNTLTPPQAGTHAATANLWLDNINREQEASDVVKRDKPVLVVFGNPPWGDRPRQAFQVGPQPTDNLIAEWAAGAAGAVINLYDLYVAFWRFATKLLLERPDVQEPRGIVSYITNRSWLRGRAYSTMRAWLRDRGLAAEIVDLGGDIRAGARQDDEPVFAIRAGSAIGTLAFGGSKPGEVKFRRLRGTRAEKLDVLRSGSLPPSVDVVGAKGDSLGPIDWGTLADAPPITRYFTHNYPGVKTHRDELVIDVDRTALLARLHEWNTLTGEERRQMFHESSTRTVNEELAEPAGGAGYTVSDAYIVSHRYRPLDDRYLYGDRRFIDRPGTVWKYFAGGAHTPALITMDTRTSAGPVVIATNTLPGYNSFRGSYETHVFPLAPPPGVQTLAGVVSDPILTDAAKKWADGFAASAEDVGAYLLALGNAPSYSLTFAEAMEAEIVRFPATTDAQVFADAVAIGHRLLEAWSLAATPRGSWTQVATGTKLGAATIEGERVTFENGDRLEGVHAETGDFSISGYPVMTRYLEAREHLPLSVELAESIRRVAGAIAAIMDARAACDDLLQRAIAGGTVPL